MAVPPATPSAPSGWSDHGVTPRLATTRFTEVRWFEELDSTNRYALDAAAGGVAEGLTVVADVQTAGRGRLGRTWEAAPGSSLLVSLLLRPMVPVEHYHLVTMTAAVTAAEAVRALALVPVQLKWPNDLLVGGKKLGGLLAEAIPGEALVVGLGLNVRWDSFPPELAEIATACNLESEERVARADLLVFWLQRFDRLLDGLGGEPGREAVRLAYTDLCTTLGQRVRVELAHGSFEGVAIGLDEHGHLRVRRDDEQAEVVSAGDVVHLRPA